VTTEELTYKMPQDYQLNDWELRYLRKCIRYRLNKRGSKPRRDFRDGDNNRTYLIEDHRAAQIEGIADWILQD
jgi:hypothetical protein